MNKKELLARMAPEKSLPPAVAKEKTTALSQLGPLERRYAAIKVTDEKSCQQMDSLLGDVVQARKGWGSIWARIHEKSIKPIMDGVNALHEVNRAIDGPLGKLEDAGKKAIKTFRVSEQARITRAREEEEALNRKSEELQSKAEAARTLLQRGKILAQKEIIDTQAVRAFEAATPVQTENTGNRTKPAWRLVGSEVESGENPPSFLVVLEAIINGDIPQGAVILDTRYINEVFKHRPEQLAEWPGFEIFDDIQIVRK